ncbi:MAG: class I SAM-dependent methyltransferase [Archangium sp.]|nr:class I SAM-dependent methyltransferase [Archangium sp.]MDP3575832.1 class I SAM-dependent methyltransferase [Archangium sp.]
MIKQPENVQLSEEEIRPKALMVEQQRRFANDIARLLKSKASFVDVPCPACGSDRSAPAWVKYEMQYRGCLECQTIYISPRPPPPVLDDYYRHSENYAYWNDVIFPASESVRREKLFKPRAERVVEICRRHGVAGGTLLEIGAGFGTFGEEVKRLGYFGRFIAVEPTPHLAATCRSRGLDVLESPIEHVSLPEGTVDVIASFEVVEHLFSPNEILHKARRILRPGGLMIVSVPSSGGFDVMLLKEKSSSVDVEHLNYFNNASLARLFESCGFSTLEVLTPGKLDAELVRSKVLSGEVSLTNNAFLQTVLIDRWAELGDSFQEFLAKHQLSSHLWLVAQKG